MSEAQTQQAETPAPRIGGSSLTSRAKTVTVLVEASCQARALWQRSSAGGDRYHARDEKRVQARRRGRSSSESRPIKTKSRVVTALGRRPRRLIASTKAEALDRPYPAWPNVGILAGFPAHGFHLGREQQGCKEHDQRLGDRLPAASCRSSSRSRRGCSIGPQHVSTMSSSSRLARRSPSSACRAPRRPVRPARAQLHREDRRVEGGRRRRDLVRVGQRCVRDGRLGPANQKTAGKVRMLAERSGAELRALGLRLDLTPRAGWACAHQRLDARRRQRRQDAEHRGPGQVRGQRRRHAARAGQAAARLTSPPSIAPDPLTRVRISS